MDFQIVYKLLFLLGYFSVFKMDFGHIRLFLPSLFATALLTLGSAPGPANATSKIDLNALETQFQLVSDDLYSALSKTLRQCQHRTKSLKRLLLQLEKLKKNDKNIIGNCLIQYNFPLLKAEIDSKDIFPVFEYLLENNNLLFANKLYLIAQDEGDSSLLSNISFIYARYYLKRKQWEKVIQHVKGTFSNLSSEDANLALLINGLALQKIKQHREAVKIYLKISKKSKYYPATRLNIATAYIRQDWWTDAHIKIDEILRNKKASVSDEMINRLYLVLGYSLLRKEFYRDSREAFRNVELNSQYTNKALLGVALTATNQEDFVGALNAINILKSKKTYDLSVDESHLLLPYLYEKLSQNLTASASYTDALNYYESRINNLNSLKNEAIISITAKQILENKNQIKLNKNSINFSDYYPVSFLENTKTVNNFNNYIVHIKNKKLKSQYSSVKNTFNKTLDSMIIKIINKRVKYLTSYMNQSRFGLARLFDKNNMGSN